MHRCLNFPLQNYVPILPESRVARSIQGFQLCRLCAAHLRVVALCSPGTPGSGGEPVGSSSRCGAFYILEIGQKKMNAFVLSI